MKKFRQSEKTENRMGDPAVQAFPPRPFLWWWMIGASVGGDLEGIPGTSSQSGESAACGERPREERTWLNQTSLNC